MYAKFAARTPGIGQCQAIHRANPAGEGCERSLGGRMARHYCALPKGTRQAGRWQTAAHWLCRGLRIATVARPPRLTRGACRRIIVGHPRSWQGSPPGPLGGRMESLGAKLPPHVLAHPPALLAGAGTYLPCWVCSFQGRTNHADWSCAKVWMISCITCLSSPSSLSSKSSSNFCCLGVR